MAKHNSKYAQNLAKRKHAGMVHFPFTVDRAGQMTLNPVDIVKDGGRPRVRSFSRLRRADEL